MTASSRSFLSTVDGLKRVVAVVVLVAAAPFLTNCYGAFPLTKAVYKANGDIENGLLRQVVFWVFVIVPVYEVAAFADAVAFNLIDFWTGEGVDFSSTTDQQGNTVTLQPTQDGHEAVLTVSKAGKTIQELRFVRASDSVCNVYDSKGALVGKAERTPAGELRLTDAQDRMVTVVSADQVGQVLAARTTDGR
jgi:hypothetical protein